MDYIGIDAYFPLIKSKTPTVAKLTKAWKRITTKLHLLSLRNRKPVIITEYGYRSCDRACWNQWEIESLPDTSPVNLEAQINGYSAFYEALWKERWLAGAFLWKWHAHETAGGYQNSNYTPQNKPVEAVIKNWYGKEPVSYTHLTLPTICSV